MCSHGQAFQKSESRHHLSKFLPQKYSFLHFTSFRNTSQQLKTQWLVMSCMSVRQPMLNAAKRSDTVIKQRKRPTYYDPRKNTRLHPIAPSHRKTVDLLSFQQTLFLTATSSSEWSSPKKGWPKGTRSVTYKWSPGPRARSSFCPRTILTTFSVGRTCPLRHFAPEF